jgi:16S rRNA (cytosine967-C5)-methyltransferase
LDPSRVLALKVLLEWEKKRSSLDLLFQKAVLKEGLTDLKKAFARELVFGTVRWMKRIDWSIERFLQKGIDSLSPSVRNALRLGAYQLLFLDRVPPWAAVSESVELVKEKEGKKAGGLVNAILRNIAREKERLIPDSPDPLERLSLQWSFPLWLVKRLHKRFGEETEALLKALNEPPPFTIRTNILKTSREDLMEILSPFRPEPTRWSPVGIILGKPQGVLESQAFKEGLFQVQDEGAQLLNFILSPQKGERILDVCAAPGGKTTHMAELMGNEGEIVALEVNPWRIKWMRENLERLGITIVEVHRYNATEPINFKGFDRVLADVPCSGFGVLRRNPDLKWRMTEKEIYRLKEIQKRILRNSLETLKEGGLLLYSTCTFTFEENEEVVKEIAKEKGASIVSLKEHAFLQGIFFNEEGFFLSLPHEHGTDGFFGALLRKS